MQPGASLPPALSQGHRVGGAEASGGVNLLNDRCKLVSGWGGASALPWLLLSPLLGWAFCPSSPFARFPEKFDLTDFQKLPLICSF